MIIHVSERQAELILDCLYDASNSLRDYSPPDKEVSHSKDLYHKRVDRLIDKLNRQILAARATKLSAQRRRTPEGLEGTVREVMKQTAPAPSPSAINRDDNPKRS